MHTQTTLLELSNPSLGLHASQHLVREVKCDVRGQGTYCNVMEVKISTFAAIIWKTNTMTIIIPPTVLFHAKLLLLDGVKMLEIPNVALLLNCYKPNQPLAEPKSFFQSFIEFNS